MAEAWREVLGAWDDYSGAPDAYRELDGERVLVFLHLGGRGKTSGMELEQLTGTGATLFHIAERLIVVTAVNRPFRSSRCRRSRTRSCDEAIVLAKATAY